MLVQNWRGVFSRQKKSSSKHAHGSRFRFGIENLEARQLLAADLVISEVVASNDKGFEDEDMGNPDWFEIFNAGDETAEIGGWYATDDSMELSKWQFPPATSIGPGEFLTVFASDKDRSETGSELHTNFKFSSGGEYIALVESDGTTIDADLTFGQQYTDISYGPEQTNLDYSFIESGASAQVLVPSSGAVDSSWTDVGFDDGAWATQTMGVGFDGGGELLSLVSADGDLSSMQGANAGAYVRSTFTIDGDVPTLDGLDLNINYDDGFIAYLNGTEVARSNAPDNATWNSSATQSHGGTLASLSFEDFSDEAVQEQFQLNGESKFENGVARATVSSPFQEGTIFLKEPIPFGADYTFSTSMHLDVHSDGGFQNDADGRGGQGMTFVLQSGGPFQVGDDGVDLALANLGAPFVAIELDSFATGAFDPDDSLPSHIGINTSLDGNVARVGIPKFNTGSVNTNPEYLWVDYDGFTGELEVFLASENVKPAEPTLTTTVDFDAVFSGVPSLWAGWTASTTLAWNAHDIFSWEITTESSELGASEETFDISAFTGALQSGENVLSVHGMNVDANDNDFLVSASLQGVERNVLFRDSIKFFVEPTPGDTNGGGTEAPAGQVDFSVTGRTFADSFALELTPPTETATIRYTLDGTVPTELATVYSGPITITESTRVRAVAFDDGFAPGLARSESFILIGESLTSFEGGNFESNLPIIVMDSFSDTRVHSDDRRLGSTAAVFIDVDPVTGVAGILDEPDVAVTAGTRIRGQSSQGWPKKQYAFEAWDDTVDYSAGRILASEAKDKNISPFGLPGDSDWVLNGPYSDKTQLNNHLAFKLYNDLGNYSPRTMLVEVFINSGAGGVDISSDYRGTYVLIEKIKIDNDRVDLPDAVVDPVVGQDPRTVGGYIFKQDKSGAGDVTFSTTGHGGPSIPLKFVDPGNPSLEQRNWMTAYVNEAEEVLYSDNWLDPDEGYRKYFDTETFIDHWLMTELAKEIDGYRISEYFILAQDGKITKGPAWDFNLSFSNGNYLTGGRWDGWYYTGISGAQYHWYHRLLDDPGFEAELVDRWFELRETTFSKDYIFSVIDGYVDQITNGSPNFDNPTAAEGSNPISRNFDRWGTVASYLWPNCFHTSNNPSAHCRPSPLTPEMSPNGAPNSYDDYVFIMKDFVENRLSWIDSQFGTPITFDPPGGLIAEGTQVAITAETPGTIYYTTDGTDPQNPQTIVTENVVLPAGAPLEYHVPADNTLIDACKATGISLRNPENCFINPEYVLGTQGESWSDGNGGIGYGFAGDVTTDIQAEVQGVNASTYLRIPFEFTAEEKDVMTGARLNVNYDDGYIAYLWFDALNLPVEIGRKNVGGSSPAFPVSTKGYDESAIDDRAAGDATTAETLDFSNRRQYLNVGTNYLVIQLMNDTAASTDLLFDVELVYLTESIALPDNVMEYNGPITIDTNTELNVRTYDEAADEWGSRRRENYFIDLPPLVITELNYNPAPATATEIAAGFDDSEMFEWIELMNVGSDAFDLSGVRVGEAINFGFDDGASLAAGDRGVIVRNRAAFEARYGAGINVIGDWADPVDQIFSDKLSNDGEQITLTGAVNEPLLDFTYNDIWYPLTDGGGFSLTIVDPNAGRTTWNDASSWRVSDRLGGTPGSSDAGVAPPSGSIVINELLAVSSTGADAIELRNISASPVELGNFFLTDDPTQMEKYRIAANTTVPANGYLVLDSSNVTGGFALSDTGGRVIIQGADAAGVPLGFQVDRGFEAADPDVTEGVYTNSVGNVDFVPQTENTLGAVNSGPTIGPLVVTELMYDPAPGAPEWLELQNTSDETLDLAAASWSIAEAFNYTFPDGATLPAGSFALLVQGADGADHSDVAAAFRAANSVPADVEIYVYEPTANGGLNNNGEDLSVGRLVGDGPAVIKTELVEYDNNEPWPTGTDGTGRTLSRLNATSYGNEPTNWTAGPVSGTPGIANPNGPAVDVNQDGSLDIADLDIIYDAIRTGQYNGAADLDADGEVQFSDVENWLSTAGLANVGSPYCGGDANLDGAVDVRDLNRVGVNWTSDVIGWGQGDFNADFVVNAADLNQVGINWQKGVVARSPRAPLAAFVNVTREIDAIPVVSSQEIVLQESSDSRLDEGSLSRRRSTESTRRRIRSTQSVETPERSDELADEVFAAW